MILIMHHNFFIIYFVKVKILDLLGSKNDTLCRTEGIYTYGKAAHTLLNFVLTSPWSSNNICIIFKYVFFFIFPI